MSADVLHLERGDPMLALLLVLVLVYVAIGIIGFVVHGLFWLFIVAAVLFVLTLVGGGFRVGGRGRGVGSGR